MKIALGPRPRRGGQRFAPGASWLQFFQGAGNDDFLPGECGIFRVSGCAPPWRAASLKDLSL